MNIIKKNVLVTGGAGFIGSHLAEKIIKLCNRVVVYDTFNDFYLGKEKNLKGIEDHPNFTLIRGDVLDFDNLNKTTKGIDIVFHLAAQPGVRYSLQHPVITNSINTSGTLNVLKAALENGVEKVVNASSSSVYGDNVSLPIKETTTTNPISPYGASKLAAENYCNIYNQLFGLNVVSLRYFTVYGPRQRPDMAIHKFVKQIQHKTPLTIFGDGEQTRDFTYVDDIVKGTIAAAEEDYGGEIFNLGSGHQISINDLLEVLHEALGDFEIHYDEKKKGDMSHTWADITKAKKLLGYKPRVELKEGINRFLQWFKQYSA